MSINPHLPGLFPDPRSEFAVPTTVSVLSMKVSVSPFVPMPLELMTALALTIVATIVIVTVGSLAEFLTPLVLEPTTFLLTMTLLFVFVSTIVPVTKTKKIFEAMEKRFRVRVLGNLEKMMVFMVMKRLIGSMKMMAFVVMKRLIV